MAPQCLESGDESPHSRDVLVIRADADERQGTGHVMRCLALAHAWRAPGRRVVFLSRCTADGLCRRIRAIGAELLSLEHAHPDPSDCAAMERLLGDGLSEGSRIGAACPHPLPLSQRERGEGVWAVLDGYHFDADYQRAIRDAGARLLVIDDMAQLAHYHADALLSVGTARA